MRDVMTATNRRASDIRNPLRPFPLKASVAMDYVLDPELAATAVPSSVGSPRVLVVPGEVRDGPIH
jgi:hypothetical protein